MPPLPLGLHALLGLLLVLALQFSGLHRLAHAAEAQAGLPQTETCDTCVALAALDTPSVDAARALPTALAHRAFAPPYRAVGVLVAGAPCAYRSRAPPRWA